MKRTMCNANRRRHIRYRSPAPAPVVELVVSSGDETYRENALIENESHSGLACIYLGNALDTGCVVDVKEGHGVSTRYEVARCEELDKHVLRLGLKRLGT